MLSNLNSRVRNSSQLSKGTFACLLGTVLWAFTGIFIRYLTVNFQLPPLVLAFWRDLLVFAALASFFAFFKRERLHIDRRHAPFLVLYGGILAVFNSLWTVSVTINGAAIATVLVYSSAAFTAILGRLFFGEWLSPYKILAVTLSLAGCALVAGVYNPAAWQLNPLGIFTGLISGLGFAAYSLMGRVSAQRRIYPWSALMYSFGLATPFILLFNLLISPSLGGAGSANLMWLGTEWLGWLVLLVLAVGPTLGGFGFYTVSLGYLPASVANLIATLEPVMTAALAYLLLGERLSAVQIAGSALIFSGVLLLRLSERGAAAEPAGYPAA